MTQRLIDLDPKNNSIGFLRLLCASLVILGHARPVGGYGTDPLLALTNNQLATGRFPVDIFFCISGYLIAASYIGQGSFWRFAWARFLRIYPAFWVCIFLTAFPLTMWVTGAPAPSYFFHNFTLIPHLQSRIPGLFGADGGVIGANGALWTLPWEVRAYALVAALGLLGLLRRPVVVGSIFALYYAYFVWQIVSHPGLETSPAVTGGARLLTFFFAGTLFYLMRDRIPISGRIAAGMAAVLVVATFVGVLAFPHSAGLFYIAAPVPLTYCVFYLAIRLPPVFRRINSRTDISYGVYIYGTLALNCVTSLQLGLSFSAYVALAYGSTLILGTASWFLIEKPAMSLKGRPLPRSGRRGRDSRAETAQR